MTGARRLRNVLAAGMLALLLVPGSTAAATTPPSGSLRQPDGARGCWSQDRTLGCGSIAGFVAPGPVPSPNFAVAAPAFAADGRSALLPGPFRLVAVARNAATGALARPAAAAHCYAPTSSSGCVRVRAIDRSPAAVFSPDGRHAYVASADGVAVFARDPLTGALTQLPMEVGCVTAVVKERCARGRGITHPVDLALSPDGATLYVTGELRDPPLAAPAQTPSLAVFRRDPVGGGLTQPTGPAACFNTTGEDGCTVVRVSGGPAVAASPDGRNVYTGSSRGLAAFARDVRTGELTELPGPAGCLTSGGTLGCGALRGLAAVSALAMAPDGAALYAASARSGSLVTLARETPNGVLRQPAGGSGCLSAARRPGCRRVQGLAGVTDAVVTPDGDNVYTAAPGEKDGGDLVLLRRDRRTGAVQPLRGEWGCINARGIDGCHLGTGLASPRTLAVTPDGRHIYVVFEQALALFVRRTA